MYIRLMPIAQKIFFTLCRCDLLFVPFECETMGNDNINHIGHSGFVALYISFALKRVGF